MGGLNFSLAPAKSSDNPPNKHLGLFNSTTTLVALRLTTTTTREQQLPEYFINLQWQPDVSRRKFRNYPEVVGVAPVVVAAATESKHRAC